MGDRTYLEVIVKDIAGLNRAIIKKHPSWLENQFGDSDEQITMYLWDESSYDEKSKLTTVEMWEANYGMWEELKFAASQGVEFFGHHGSGGGYMACDFVSLNGELVGHMVDTDGRAVVPVDRLSGEPDKGEVENVKKRLLLYRELRKKWRLEDNMQTV